MRSIAFFLFLFVSTATAAQGNKNAIRNTTDTIRSNILKEDRFIRVYVPDSSSGSISVRHRYPVIYILDGEAHFYTVIDLLKQLSKETGNMAFSRMIVVGIGNIWERDKDYTPTHITSSPFVDTMAARNSGGGEKFISFLEKELIPYVESKYPAATSRRMLMGHSLGGLTVINALVHHTKLFNYYMAIDPSMWWDDQKLLQQAKTFLEENTLEGTSLFLAVANTMNKEMDDVAQIKNDKTEKTVLIRPSLVLADYVTANKKNKLKFDWKYYKDQNHMSVPPPAAYDALKFLLRSL